jgi:hypothetical protein
MRSKAIEDVIAAITENRTRFEAFCYSLSQEQLNRAVPNSTWIVRDFAAHLGALDNALLNWFALAGGGAKADFSIDADGRAFDVDEFNDAEVASRRDWPLRSIFAEAEVNRRKLISAIAELTDEQIDRPMHFGGDSKRPPADLPLRTFLQGWAQHDPIHVADMMKALPELAGDASITAWLDNVFVRGYQRIMNAGTAAQAGA